MNPFRIGTSIHQLIDQWHYWIMRDGRHHLIVDVEMRRTRDIEDECFEMEFWATISRKNKPETLKVLTKKKNLNPVFTKKTLPELRSLVADWVASISNEDWQKVIAVCVEPPEKFSGLRFNYGVGLRSKCGKFYRSEGEAYGNTTPTFCDDWSAENGTVHEYTEALEEGLRIIEKRIDELAFALLKLTRNAKQVEQIESSLQKLLPE